MSVSAVKVKVYGTVFGHKFPPRIVKSRDRKSSRLYHIIRVVGPLRALFHRVRRVQSVSFRTIMTCEVLELATRKSTVLMLWFILLMYI